MWTLPLLGLLFLSPGDSSDNKITSDRLAEILDEVRTIRKLLEAGVATASPQAEFTPVAFSVNDDSPMLGAKDAPLTIVEFVDYGCYHCKQFYRHTFHDIKKVFIDTKKVRFYVVDFPVGNQSDGLLPAIAGRCAREQNGFWALHERMLGSEEGLEGNTVTELARTIPGMDIAAFQACLSRENHKQQIQERAREAANAGVVGTPSFIIGASTATGVKGELVTGALPFRVVQQKIERSLK